MRISRTVLLIIIFASLSSFSAVNAEQSIPGDLNGDYEVDIEDFFGFAQQWLDPFGCSGLGCADFDGENGVNMADFALLAGNWQQKFDNLVINEFLASNIKTLLDGDLQSSDWIEIYNPGYTPTSLDGWFLTDDPENLKKWPFPDGITLKGGYYLLVFASGQDVNDYNDPEGYYHTNFKLSSDGEYLALVRPDGVVVHDYNSYQLSDNEFGYPPQQTDISYGIDSNETVLCEMRTWAKYVIPEDDSLGQEWIENDFVPIGWTTCWTGIGYSDHIEIETAGQLFVDATYKDFSSPGQVYQWINHGTLGGYFDCDGTVIWLYGAPEIYLAPRFDGTNHMKANFLAPDGITSDSDWSLETWVYNQSIDSQEAVVQWTNNIGYIDGGISIFGYGTSGSSGAMIHNGSTDIGYDGGVPSAENWHHIAVTYEGGTNGAERVYVDGKLNTTEQKSLDIYRDDNMRLGTAGGDLNYTGFLAAVRMHDGVLTTEQVVNNFLADALHFKVPLPPDLDYISPLIRTNVKQQMYNINSSAYIRIEFNVTDPNLLSDTLMLNMYYDDGFIAYINGTEVARRNAPANPTWNSSATAERTDPIAAAAEAIDITSYRHLLMQGKNLLAIHGLNVSNSDEDFLILPVIKTLSLNFDSYREWFFSKPTPLLPNDDNFINLVDDTRFSVDRGFYEQPFQVRIATDAEDAVIRYTTDGSAPTETHGTIYEANNPIQITNTTCLRAAAFKNGYIPSNVDTQTYIFLEDVINQPYYPEGFPTSWGNNLVDYAMDSYVVYDPNYYPTIKDDLKTIPSVCIGIDDDDFFGAENGIYANASESGIEWERPTSIEWIDPVTNKTYQANAGLRVHGGVGRSSSVAKHSLRILAKSIYGPTKLEFPFFNDTEVDKFDSLVLRATWNYSWIGDSGGNTERAQYMRELYSHDTIRDMDRLQSFGRHVHLYINGLYWGLYILTERPDDGFAEEHLGGDKSDYDVIKTYGEVLTGADMIEVVAGDLQAWNEMFALAEAGLSSTEAYAAIQEYVDIPALIDYMLMIFHVGSRDAPVFIGDPRVPRNFYAIHKRQPGAGFLFLPWDVEWSLEDEGVDRVNIGSYIDGYDNPAYLFAELTANEEFRLLVEDRSHKHFFNDGQLVEQKTIDRYWNRIMDIDRAIVGESARWGDSLRFPPYTRDIEWITERNRLINEYFPIRNYIVISQLQYGGLYPYIEAPSFYINGLNQHGGYINSGDSLMMTAPEGIIYYTLDGSEPRLPGSGGGYSEITLISEDASKKILVPDSNIGTTWQGGSETYDDNDWDHGTYISGKTGGVGYERSTGYEDYISYDVESEMYGNMASCYIRISFTVDAEDLAEFDTLTLKVRCDDGFVAFINGVEATSINKPNPFEWNSNCADRPDDSSFAELAINDYISDLHAGTNVLAIHAMNSGTTSSDFLSSVELIAGIGDSTPEGVSPTAIEYTAPFTIGSTRNIKARVKDGDYWSALCDAVFAVGPVADNLRITEIMYHPCEWPPVDPNAEFIELKNIGLESINLNLVKFTNGIQFTFPDVTLEANQCIVVVKDTNAFETEYGTGINTIGEYEGKLDNAGERIRLADALGNTILDFEYKDGWRSVTDGEGYSLTINDEFNPDPNSWGEKDCWSASIIQGGTPGMDDSGPRHGDILINEILAHSHALAPDWIELHNTTNEPIDIGGWFISDSDANLTKYEIAEGTEIPANGYIVFYEDTNFGPLSSDTGAHVPFALSEAGEEVCLSSGLAGQPTGYRNKEDFGASETGIAFGRYYKESTDNYNFVAMSENTPMLSNAYPKVGPVVISEIMYHPEIFWGNWDAEYIELCNITDDTVSLYDVNGISWKFTDGIEFTFPPYTSMPPKAIFLVVRDVNIFQTEFNDVPPGAQIFQWESGRLDNGGEKIEISAPGDYDENGDLQYIRIDRVSYSDGSHPDDFDGITDPWPAQADGLGKSLEKIDQNLYGNDPNIWQAAVPTPGQIVISEWTLLTYDDFEISWGYYTTGGSDCIRYTSGLYAYQGNCAANIQDDSGDASAFWHTESIDVDSPGYTQIKIEFWFLVNDLEAGESFLVEYYDGSDWQTIQTFVAGTDFPDNTITSFYNQTIYINEGTYNFPTDMKLKFECVASSNTDDVYIDQIALYAK